MTTAEVKGLQECADSHEQKEKRSEAKKQRGDGASCLTDFNLLRARVEYAEKWVESHEKVLDWLTAANDTRRAAVRVLRYEQLAESPCTCQRLLTFAFGDAMRAGGLLVPEDEVFEACRYKPAPCTESRRSLGYSRPKEASVPATAVVIRAVSGDIRNWRCTMHHAPCTTAPPHHRTTAPPHHRTTASPHHRITASPHHRITAPRQHTTAAQHHISTPHHSMRATPLALLT